MNSRKEILEQPKKNNINKHLGSWKARHRMKKRQTSQGHPKKHENPVRCKKTRLVGHNRIWDKGQTAIIKGKLTTAIQAWHIITKYHLNITVLSHKPHTYVVLLQGAAMGLHSISRLLQHHTTSLYHLLQHNHKHQTPKKNARPNEPSNHTIATDSTARQGILHYTYWLTAIHSGNFRDVPLIEDSVEGGSTPKHCGKDKQAD